MYIYIYIHVIIIYNIVLGMPNPLILIFVMLAITFVSVIQCYFCPSKRQMLFRRLCWDDDEGGLPQNNQNAGRPGTPGKKDIYCK